MRSRLLPIALLLALAGVSAASADGEGLTYAGATTLQRDFMPAAAHAFQQETGIPFRLEGGNSDPGIRALQAGLVNVAGSGRFLHPPEKAAGLVGTLIGWDAMVVLVHQSNPVKNLTMEQLQGIFSGRIDNWSQVGGPNQPILVITAPQGSGMRDSLQDNLGIKEFTRREITAALVADADLQVAAMPVAICALSKSMADAAEVKIIEVNGILPAQETVASQAYPLVKPLLLVTRGKPEGAVAAFIDFCLGPKGQEIISRKFFRAR